jgi:mannobiose 2-epimerase
MKKHTVSLVILCLLCFTSCTGREEGERRLQLLREEVLSDLITNVLPFWENYSPDPSGGFYGAIANDGTPDVEADKGLVLNARILWTFSAAYRTFEVENYKKLADRAQRYLIDYFADPEYGGMYWSVNPYGIPVDTDKQTYGLAFAIYAFAEHYRATGDAVSLERAVNIYNTLEYYAYDAVNGGYIDSFSYDWLLPVRYGYDGRGNAPKTMNTHIHVLEALTNLYRVWADEQLRERLKGLAELFFDNIIDPETCHERLFFTMEWESLEEVDSYGHDMEISWLLCEAADVIGDKDLIERTNAMAICLVETQMQEGWTEEGYLLYEKTDGELSKTIEWWPQAEAVVAFINAWQLTGNGLYATAASTTWEWIKEYLIDREHGEWYYRLDENFMPVTTLPKASLWKCPYHTTRMALEAVERIHWGEEEKQ